MPISSPLPRAPSFVPTPLDSLYAPARISTSLVRSVLHIAEGKVNMAEGTLILHAGGKLVTLDDLGKIQTPPPEGRWHPTPHLTVLTAVKETLRGAGYVVKSEKLAVAREGGARFFGILNLDSPLAAGVGLSVGVRNSFDKSFPLGFAAGSHCFVCDNLAFRAELLIRRKHTVNGMKAFGTAIGSAVASLTSFKESEALRIRRMAEMELTREAASHVILTAYRRGIISALQLPKVCAEWEEPRYAEFAPRTAWSLFNAFTEVLKPRAVSSPQTFVAATIRLNGLMLPEGTDVPHAAA